MATVMAHHGPTQQALSLLVLLLFLQIHLTIAVPGDPSSAVAAFTSNHTLPLSVRCLPDQESALLRLKRSFTTTNYSVSAFRSWRSSTDCCRWAGVQCSSDSGGRVTSLDLGDHGLEAGGLDPVLFHLTSLEYLNLAYNYFNGSQLPSSGFSGPVPTGINKLTNLVSLDLSTSFDIIEVIGDGFLLHSDFPMDSIGLVEENFGNLVHNLRDLRELRLGSVDLSNIGSQWCHTIAMSCPKLQVLSLPWCELSGPICSSFSRLQSLAVIDLQLNDLSGLLLPDFLTNLSNLTVLQLRHNNLQGWISPAIFQHKKLVTIDLYYNLDISGYLPNFSNGSRLENLDVVEPISLKLGLAATGFPGDLPSSIGNLKSLSALEISGTGIVGPMPSWVANLTALTTLRFDNYGLFGPLPSFIGNLTHLKELVLCACGLSGEIPSHLSNLTQLQILLPYSNNFVGTIELNFFRKLPNLNVLDLSHNNLTLLDGEDNSTLTSLPRFWTLGLAGCRMSKFPNFLRHQDQINRLDLSDNELHGAIPQWVWENLNDLYALYIGNNKLTSVGYAPFLPLQLDILVLSNNIFEGAIPIPQGSAGVLDYSNNRFSSIPYNFSYHLRDVGLFDASRNNLSGNIPLSFCSGTRIQLLYLSNNNFSGLIPSCLMENVNGMQSLNLRENGIHGEFRDNIKEGCSFEALDFSGNWIEGKLPRSLVFCKNLEILDVANNRIMDTFPCWMSAHHRLAILVLKSNKFFGQVGQSPHEEGNACAFPSAIIIDLSSNNFSGPLPNGQWFRKLKSMIFRDLDTSSVMDHELPDTQEAYKYTTTITYKGHDTMFAQILTTLVFIDLSNNAFSDGIPEAIGELGLLHGLNISHNSLIGTIPSQFSHLGQLEALDLSSNQLSGMIPQELALLDFLTTLNLSNNKLVGSIPESNQFSIFSNSSFIGNDGLCGPPLSKECINRTLPNVVPHHSKRSTDIMLFLFAGLGFGVGNIITAPCFPADAPALLQLKNSFLDPNNHLTSWRAGTDCCRRWEAVSCDAASRRVRALDLGYRDLQSRRLHPSLFNLTALTSLTLASNNFMGATLPSAGLEQLTEMVYLNFSYTNFFGQIPAGIARLKNLVTLDFSSDVLSYNVVFLREPSFEAFVSNLNSLTVLNLDGVDISSGGEKWSIALAKSTPKLQMLFLSQCGLSGTIHHSFSRLHSLVDLELSGNGITGKVPEWLDLSDDDFEGKFPAEIFQLQNLTVLSLSGNPRLSGHLVNFPVENKLEMIFLEGTNFSDAVPVSIVNLKSLMYLALTTEGTSKQLSLLGKLPSLDDLTLYGSSGLQNPQFSWIGDLRHLTRLEIAFYNFSEPIPSWIGNLTNLTDLGLTACNFYGHVPSWIGNLTQLSYIDFSENRLTGDFDRYISP
ncbi:hypothetical protein U9M48_020860 [Paspalum notatum var. saurae]|uniref:Leucine-rich repeat-containing N-terminal plant-type domain-containing protein n=1 Tax=Paspalum notatum var. saurae TaxID=547442 RepID=A0AAQ3TG38_PASNO